MVSEMNWNSGQGRSSAATPSRMRGSFTHKSVQGDEGLAHLKQMKILRDTYLIY